MVLRTRTRKINWTEAQTLFGLHAPLTRAKQSAFLSFKWPNSNRRPFKRQAINETDLFSPPLSRSPTLTKWPGDLFRRWRYTRTSEVCQITEGPAVLMTANDMPPPDGFTESALKTKIANWLKTLIAIRQTTTTAKCRKTKVQVARGHHPFSYRVYILWLQPVRNRFRDPGLEKLCCFFLSFLYRHF